MGSPHVVQDQQERLRDLHHRTGQPERATDLNPKAGLPIHLHLRHVAKAAAVDLRQVQALQADHPEAAEAKNIIFRSIVRYSGKSIILDLL